MAVCEIPPQAILANCNTRHMSGCSTLTWPPCLAIVAAMLKSNQKLVDATNNQIRLLPQPYMLLKPPLWWLNSVLSTPRDADHEIGPWKFKRWQKHDVRFRALCRQMPWSNIDVYHSGQHLISHVALNTYPLYIIRWVDGCLTRYGYNDIELHAVAESCCIWVCGLFFDVHSES